MDVFSETNWSLLPQDLGDPVIASFVLAGWIGTTLHGTACYVKAGLRDWKVRM